MQDEKEKKSWLKRFAFFDRLKTKKYSSYVIAIVLSLIVCVIFLSSCNKQSKTKTYSDKTTAGKTISAVKSYSAELENKLVNVLGAVKGCGSVRAMVVTKSTNISNIIMQSEEKSTSGGEKVELSPIYEKNGSSETPFVSSYTYPEIVGVLIVAKGAGDTNVKLKIISAVVAVLGIDSSKIEVLEGN